MFEVCDYEKNCWYCFNKWNILIFLKGISNIIYMGYVMFSYKCKLCCELNIYNLI